MKNCLLVSIMLLAVLLFTKISIGQDVSSEAQRHMIRGKAAMKEAETETDYKDAVDEFKKATRLAPKWAEAWFNLGVAQETVKDFSGAMRSYGMYVKLSPDADDKDQIKTHIIELEYKRDKARRMKDSVVAQRRRFLQRLSGQWRDGITFYKAAISGNSISFEMTGNNIGGKFYAQTNESIRGIIAGLKITGTRTIDYGVVFSNGRKFTRRLTGIIDNSGDKITFEYQDVVPDGAVGIVANGWLTVPGKKVLIRTSKKQ